VDDRPYGGGPGMVMLARPLEATIAAAKQRQVDLGLPAPRVVFMSPQGKPLTHERVMQLKDDPAWYCCAAATKRSTSACWTAASMRKFPSATSCCPAANCRRWR
jgi:hypothetical protein